MHMATRNLPPGSSGAPLHSLRGSFRKAMRYWEPLRIAYNFFLVGVVLLWVALTWPHFRQAVSLSSLLPMGFLALMANVCYCTAYLIDIPIQRAAVSALRWGRWTLWALGTVLAIVLANYWIADEIYPDFH
jgi:hypothetical protein